MNDKQYFDSLMTVLAIFAICIFFCLVAYGCNEHELTIRKCLEKSSPEECRKL